MDVLGPLFQLLFRVLFVVLPLTMGWLAFRRLMLSRSANAWNYATTCLFMAVLAAGLLPWMLGLGSANWLFFMFSATSPVIWMGVVMICDPVNQPSAYDPEVSDEAEAVPVFAPRLNTAQPERPLVLEKPDWPDAPTPVFRHKMAAPDMATAGADQAASRSLLAVAKGMRGNINSENRRPRLLPAPDHYGTDLPFLHRG